jgi:hypothetical protein
MPAEEDPYLQSNLADVSLCAFALTDCIVEIESHSARYLRAVHRTALELAVPNLYGPQIGGYWLTPVQLEQLRMLPECYPSSESKFVRHAVESYLSAQTGELPLIELAPPKRVVRGFAQQAQPA